MTEMVQDHYKSSQILTCFLAVVSLQKKQTYIRVLPITSRERLACCGTQMIDFKMFHFHLYINTRAVPLLLLPVLLLRSAPLVTAHPSWFSASFHAIPAFSSLTRIRRRAATLSLCLIKELVVAVYCSRYVIIEGPQLPHDGIATQVNLFRGIAVVGLCPHSIDPARMFERAVEAKRRPGLSGGRGECT